MKTIVSVSNFSLDTRRFSNAIELDASLSQLRNVQSLFRQDKVEYCAGNDILEHNGFGPSFIEQADNFSYAGDKGVQAFLYTKLYQSYLYGFDLSFSTDELMEKANRLVLEEGNESYVLYVPKLVIYRTNVVKDVDSFSHHYENLLSKYPIDEQSYYDRAKSHFDSITFHSDCGDTLKAMGDGGINSFSIAITKCLKALNEYQATMKIPEDLEILGHITNFDCTTQGKNGKEDMSFVFPEISKTNKVNCEYHLKPHSSNDPKDNKYYHKRIYFTFANVGGRVKTFVASIGPHL
ncbi:hypothetical protein [Vibrio harveyi]|uniref:hypothetical protein n=1 Tax=Vibrio harveyi TaxID=669 RepID=UPI0023F6D312|nr:hypothetical protein [Vibrio harveyi]MDF6015577.1 hypothetical protein [Vibrio harveyi]